MKQHCLVKLRKKKLQKAVDVFIGGCEKRNYKVNNGKSKNLVLERGPVTDLNYTAGSGPIGS